MASLAEMMNGLSDIIEGKMNQLPNWASAPAKVLARVNPITGVPMQINDLMQGTFVENERNKAGQLARIPADLVSAVPGLYGLADMAPRLWGSEDAGLPGAKPALEFAQKTQDVGKEIGTAITGKEQNDFLLDGTSSELASSWARLALPAVIPAPLAITAQVDKGIKMLEAGTGIAARTGEYAVKGLEMLSPIMMRTPTPVVQGASAGISLGAGLGLELAFPDPDKKKLDATIAKATDVAVAGWDQAKEGTEIVKQTINPVQASILPKTGNETVDAVMPYAAVGAAIFAGYKTGVLDRVMKSMAKNGDETTLSGADLLRRQVVDQMVPAKEKYADVLRSANYPNAEDAIKTMANKIDEGTGQAVSKKFESMWEYGEAPNTAIKMPPPKDFYTKLQTLTEQEQEAARRAVLSRNEYYDDAARSTRDAAMRGHDWNAVTANPKLQAVVNEYDSITKRMADYELEQRSISPQMHQQLIRDNALSFPAQLSRAGMDSRDRAMWNNVRKVSGGDPFADLPQMMRDRFRAVAWNNVKRDYFSMMRAADDVGDPVAKLIMGRRDVTGVTDKNAQIVHYRDANGTARTQEVLDPYLYKAMSAGQDMSPLHAIQGAMPIWHGAARALEQTATGVPIAVIGQPFAHIAAAYNAITGAVTRERGTRAGLIDSGLQKIGFKPGLPGDPTIMLDWPLRAMEGIDAMMAKRVGDAIHNHLVKSAGFNGAITPSAATRIADGLRDYYRTTWVHEFQQRGALGPSTFGGINPDEAIKSIVGKMHTAGQPWGAIKETYNFAKDILHAVSAAPGASIYAMNKNLAPDLRIRAVREMTGDTARSGAYESASGELGKGVMGGVGKLGGMTPWWGPMVHGTDKLLRSLNPNNPKQAMSTIVGATTMIGLPAISAALWTVELGPEYVDYMYNKRPPSKIAGNIYIPIPGLPPESGIEFPVEPIMRSFLLATNILAGHHLGLFTGEIFKEENADMKRALGDASAARWLRLGSGSVGGEVIDQSILPPVPPLAAAGAAMLGQNLRSYTDSSQIHRRNDAGYTTNDARNPFHDVMGMHESAVMENVLKTIGGGVAETIYAGLMGAAQGVNEGASVGQISKRLGQEVSLRSNDRLRKGNGLLEGFDSISPSQEAAGKLVVSKMKGLQDLVKKYEAVTKGGAPTEGDVIGTKSRGFQQLDQKIAVAPGDEKVRLLSYYAKNKLQFIEKQFMAPNKDDYLKRNSEQITQKHSPERKRLEMNNISENIIQRNRQALLQLQQFEAQMSNMFGKQIALENLDMNNVLK